MRDPQSLTIFVNIVPRNLFNSSKATFFITLNRGELNACVQSEFWILSNHQP